MPVHDWTRVSDGTFHDFHATWIPRLPSEKPLTLASYSAYSLGYPIQAFVEPIAVGDVLRPMPLFLTSGRYINVPLEPSYMDAVSQVPDRARKPLES